MELNERAALILQAVVHSYITTADPVGSRVIVKRFGMDMSPATVRNVMADLEDAGYLQQLHTSSGRIPTDQGYRYYVDYLMRVQELTADEQNRIDHELSGRLEDADEILRRTSHLLALVTNQTGIVEMPTESDATVRHIELMPIASSRAAVLIADSFGRVRTTLIGVERPLTLDDLTRLNRYLAENLQGKSVDTLAQSLRDALERHIDEERKLAERAIEVMRVLPNPTGGRLYLEGATQLFGQPEFRDINKAREVFGVLEEHDQLAEVLREKLRDKPQPGPSVVIGSETDNEGLRDISVVASSYSVGDKRAGMVGILGPRRMPYSKLTAIVDYTSKMLTRFLTRLAG